MACHLACRLHLTAHWRRHERTTRCAVRVARHTTTSSSALSAACSAGCSSRHLLLADDGPSAPWQSARCPARGVRRKPDGAGWVRGGEPAFRACGDDPRVGGSETFSPSVPPSFETPRWVAYAVQANPSPTVPLRLPLRGDARRPQLASPSPGPRGRARDHGAA